MCQKCKNVELETKVVPVQFDDMEIEMELCESCEQEFAEQDARMQKEAEQLELAKKIVAAMEIGGRISISFHTDLNYSEEMARQLVSEFADNPEKDSNGGTQWISGTKGSVSCTVFIKPTKEDEIANLEERIRQLKEGDSHERTA